MNILISGASRGIGLEFVGQFLKRGDRVFAAARNPQKSDGLKSLQTDYPKQLSLHSIDVSSQKSVDALAKELSSESIDLLINNAGISGQWGELEKIDFDDMANTFEVNSIGPLRVTRAFLPIILKSNAKKVMHVTSKMGSIADNGMGRYYGYRMSKAALNMASKSLAIDFKDQGLISCVLHPGWVKTDMGGQGADITPKVSVEGMIGAIDKAGLRDSGKFFGWKGEEIPW